MSDYYNGDKWRPFVFSPICFMSDLRSINVTLFTILFLFVDLNVTDCLDHVEEANN